MEAVVAATDASRVTEDVGVITLIVADACLVLGRLGVATFKAAGIATSDSTDGVRLTHDIGAAQNDASAIMDVPNEVFNDVLQPRIGVVSLQNDELLIRIGVTSLPRFGVASLQNDVFVPRVGVISLEKEPHSKPVTDCVRDMIAGRDLPNEGIEATGAVHEPPNC